MSATSLPGPIARAITDVANARFPGGRIASVHLERGIDHLCDAIINVTLVIEDSHERLDAKKATELTRHIKSKLAELGEYSFPLLTFISKSDAEAMS